MDTYAMRARTSSLLPNVCLCAYGYSILLDSMNYRRSLLLQIKAKAELLFVKLKEITFKGVLEYVRNLWIVLKLFISNAYICSTSLENIVYW